MFQYRFGIVSVTFNANSFNQQGPGCKAEVRPRGKKSLPAPAPTASAAHACELRWARKGWWWGGGGLVSNYLGTDLSDIH